MGVQYDLINGVQYRTRTNVYNTFFNIVYNRKRCTTHNDAGDNSYLQVTIAI
jgi:hypothetical protein